MKNLRKDSTCVAYLRENGILETDNKDKADIFKGQFAYTREQIGTATFKRTKSLPRPKWSKKATGPP